MENATDKNPSNNTNIVDENKQVSCLLTQNVDKVTESEIKKVEVQKNEGDLQIKMLRVEYSEKKRNFMYAKKKLDEVQAKITAQIETINQLLHANKKIVETFNELKNFQNETILMDVNNSERTSIKCRNKNAELLNMQRMMLDNDNYTKSLNKEIIEKGKEMKNVKEQFEQEKEIYNNKNKLRTELKINIENLQAKLNQEKAAGGSLADLIEENNKRIIQLQEDQVLFEKEFKQEMDDLIRKINEKTQNLENKIKIFKEKKCLFPKLQSELSSIEGIAEKLKENLIKHETETEEIVKNVMNRKQTIEESEKTVAESIQNIKSEQEKVNTELENVNNDFKKLENDLQDQLSNLHSDLEAKKQLVKTLELYQSNLAKQKNIRIQKQEEMQVNTNDHDAYVKAMNDLNKNEQLLSNTNREQDELEIKLKELQERRDSLKEKLESADKERDNELDFRVKDLREKRNSIKKLELSKKDQEKVSAHNEFDARTPKRITPTIDLTNNFEYNKSGREVDLKASEKATKPISSGRKSIFSSRLSDSEESEDEYKIRNTPPKNIITSTPYTPRKTFYNSYSKDNESREERSFRLSQSELFDELMAQKRESPRGSPRAIKNTTGRPPSQSERLFDEIMAESSTPAKTMTSQLSQSEILFEEAMTKKFADTPIPSKNMDVFKVPQTYQSSKRKAAQKKN